MHAYYPLMWLTQLFCLFIAFTVQGVMWKGAQDHGRRGWLVAIIWAMGSTVLINAIHTAHDIWFPH
ncbi:hypothetical protein CWE17_11210 [Synechococcus sp. BS56D]|nr:hypothetical protein CWE17_11210 [Synechococcus sp. BS56D]